MNDMEKFDQLPEDLRRAINYNSYAVNIDVVYDTYVIQKHSSSQIIQELDLYPKVYAA